MGLLQMHPRGDRVASQHRAKMVEMMEAVQSQVLSMNTERVQALETWLKTTDTKLIQVNGQRKYGGPPEVWHGPIPGANCEIFISQIPRDSYEDQLIPLFSSVGPVWEFRLMMNYSGQNRGFAYAKYSSSALATEAICMLDGYMLEPGSCIKVCQSIENRHLCIEELPATTRQEDLLKVLRVMAEGVQNVSLTAGSGIEGVSAIVSFSSHYTASMAKKILVEVFKKEFALNVSIRWQLSGNLHPDEPLYPNKPPESLLASPLRPPCHILKAPQSSVLHPCLASRPPSPPGFCTTAVLYPPCPHQFKCSSSQGDRVPVESPVKLLSEVCEVTGVGQPRYEMSYTHAGRNGFLHFTYTVCIPRITTPFKGIVMILPGPTASTVLEEARQAAAKQVLSMNTERVQALETWLKTTDTKLIQVNGQRKYGGPPEVWHGPIPGANCEIFISQIPRDSYEDQLIPLFSSVGPVWEFRLMMNYSGQNRGFAYAKYSSSALATKAICMLDGYMLEPGSCIKVCQSIEKRHLCIEELPATTRQEDLLKVLRVMAEGVQNVSLTAGSGIEGVSAIVSFSSHYTASMAKKILVEVFKKEFALNVSIRWQSSWNLHPDEPLYPNKPPESLLASPLRPPCHILKAPQSSVLHPCLASRPPSPPGFCTTAVLYPPCPHQFKCSSSQGDRVPVESPVKLLSKVCEVTGVGQPRYEMSYTHAGRNGFLHFTYTVCIPRITTPFKGLVMILPGPTASTVLEEARQAAAKQVLQEIYNN